MTVLQRAMPNCESSDADGIGVASQKTVTHVIDKGDCVSRNVVDVK